MSYRHNDLVRLYSGELILLKKDPTGDYLLAIAEKGFFPLKFYRNGCSVLPDTQVSIKELVHREPYDITFKADWEGKLVSILLKVWGIGENEYTIDEVCFGSCGWTCNKDGQQVLEFVRYVLGDKIREFISQKG